MIQLVPMTQPDFETFMEISINDQTRNQIQAGNVTAEEAKNRIRKQLGQLLPDGMATPDHFFYSIEQTGSGAAAGGLWYAVEERDGIRRFFVWDIQIYEEHRRHGYGTQAFRIMEEKAREMGIPTISLYVFKTNHAARAMYEKLGYVGAASLMSKIIGLEDRSE